MVLGINTNRQNTNFYFVRASIGRILAGLKELGRENILRSHSAPVVAASNLMRGNSEADTTTTTITMMIFVMTDYLMTFVIMLMIC